MGPLQLLGRPRTNRYETALARCLHGVAKSVVGAAHFRRLAAERGLAVDAAAAGTEPDPELAPAAVKGLAADGLTATPGRPRPVTTSRAPRGGDQSAGLSRSQFLGEVWVNERG